MRKECQCGNGKFLGQEYAYGHPERYDGVSEWLCTNCGTRYGRWSGKILKEGEVEPRFGNTVKANLSIAEDIIQNMEWLETTEGDTVPCISIENLIGILQSFDVISENEAKEIYEAQD